jgi:hypothetical protein
MKLIIDIEPRYCKDMQSDVKELYYEAINRITEAVRNGKPYEETQGDFISRSALKKEIEQYQIQWNKNCDIDIAKWNCCGTILAIIDNAPAVYDNPYSDGREDGYIEGYEQAKKESERQQGEFTDLERKVIVDSINYLLGAELLEENGYTEEVINALKSVLQKLGAEENHL